MTSDGTAPPTETGEDLLAHGLSPAGAEAAERQARAHLAEAEQRATGRGLYPRPFGVAALDAWHALQRRHDGSDRPFSTPWQAFNALTGGGLWPGLHLVVGNPGSGKTQFALQLVHAAMHANLPCAYVGLELDAPGVLARLVALEAERLAHADGRGPTRPDRFAWADLYLHSAPDGRGGLLSQKQLQAAEDAHASLCELGGNLSGPPLFWDFGSPNGWSYDRLASVVFGAREQLLARGGYDDGAPLLLVLDYLQLVGQPEQRDGRPLLRNLEPRELMRLASGEARRLARDENVIVVALSSTARDNYASLAGDRDDDADDGKKRKRGDPFGEGNPSRFIGLAKEAGELESTADAVYVLGRLPDAPGPDGQPFAVGAAKLRAQASSSDPTRAESRWVRLAFNGNRFRADPLALASVHTITAPRGTR